MHKLYDWILTSGILHPMLCCIDKATLNKVWGGLLFLHGLFSILFCCYFFLMCNLSELVKTNSESF